jgi:23S rRNA pseudouridine1911/1915/1917 synthase
MEFGMNKEGLVAPHALFNFTRELDKEPMRVDRYLAEQFPLYSRSFFKKLIEEAFIKINQKSVCKQSTPVHPGDTITVQFPGERTVASDSIEARNLPIELVATHEHFFIITKPAGLIVHPPHTNSGMVTLMDWLVHHFKELESVGYIDRPGIIHRLDKDTSGLMIVPRTNYAHKYFGTLFHDRKIQKTYHAIVQGHPEAAGTIDLSVGRHPEQRTKMHAFPHDVTPKNGITRSAVTHYTVLEYFTDSTLLELKPVTGRTHQIRVHCAAIGHALVGDPIYGIKSKKIKRQALHAHTLSFTFMDKEYSFSAAPPSDFSELLLAERFSTKNSA